VVGIIPDDWKLTNIDNITSQVGDGIHSTPAYSDSGEYFFVNGNNLINNRVTITEGTKHVDRNEFQKHRKDLSDRTILMSINGTIGNLAYYAKEPVILGKSAAYLNISKGVSKHFIYYLFQTSFVKEYFENELTGSTIKNLGLGSIRRTPIPLPPTIEEQRTIATTLSDADALISRLEELIAKKRNIKQGAMQELLTGKKRLLGFSGEWETKKLGEIGEITGAGVDKKSKPEEVPVRLVNYLDVFHRDFIYSNELNHWVTAPPAKAQRCAVKQGDIFFTPSSETREDIGISAVAMQDILDAAYSYHVVRLRLFEDWDLAFRTYIFKKRLFLDQAETVCEGSGKRYVISLKRFREMDISYPSSIVEQTAIAQILSDMDAEIEALEKKLDKCKAVKQGMMQELLTGKTRLI